MSSAASIRLLLSVWLSMTTCIWSAEVRHTDSGVLMKDNEEREVHSRVKRDTGINKDIAGFNDNQAFEILKRHNDLRCLTEASDMMFMTWDSNLEASAQTYAEKCEFRHSNNRDNLAGYNYVGENLYAGTHEFVPVDVVQAWYDEVSFYNYRTRKCVAGQMCGHYTQIVWASTRTLGCGVKYCPYLKFAAQFNFTKGYNVVCHYGPGGNYVGQYPYTQGEACSKCPAEAKYCAKKMCSLWPYIEAGCNKKVGGLSSKTVLCLTLYSVIYSLFL